MRRAMRSRFSSSVKGIESSQSTGYSQVKSKITGLKTATTTSAELFLEAWQGCGQHLANDSQAPGVDFVERVLRRVPVGVPYGKIDEVAAGDAPADEREMIVTAYGIVFVDEVIFISELSRGFPDEIREPGSRAGVARDSDVRGANHIGEDHGFEALQFTGERHLSGHFAAAESVVAIIVFPLNAGAIGPVALRFFAIEENDPHIERVSSCAEQARQLEHGSGARAAVVRAHEVGNANGIVMRGIENDAGARAGKFDYDVFHSQIADQRRSVEVVLFDRTAVAFQLPNDVGLCATDSF